jgi:hypothetical protein
VREASKDVGGDGRITDGFTNGGKKISTSLGFLKIISDGLIAFLQGGKSVASGHDSCTRLGGEHLF